MKGRIIVVAALLISLTACKSGAPKRALPAATPAEPSGVVTLRLQTWGHGSSVDSALDAVIAAFQQKYPQYRVEKVQLWPDGNGGNVELGNAMKQGKVDLAQMPYQDEFVAKGSTALETYIHRDGLNLKPYGNLMEQGLVGGHTYGLPFYLMPQSLSANGELLAGAGATLPEHNWTWDDLRAAAKKVTNQVGEKPVWGLPEWVLEDLFRIYLEGQADRPAWQATDAELKDALAYFRTLISLDRSMEPPAVRTWEQDQPMDNGEEFRRRIEAFGAGRTAFDFGGFSVGAGTAKWLNLPVPSHPGRPAAMLTWVQWLAVASGSNNPDAAWAFVKFATGPEGALLAAKAGVLPAYLDETVAASWWDLEPKPAPVTNAFFNAKWLLDGLGAPGSGRGSQRNLWRVYRLANRVLTNSMAEEAALAEFHKEMEGGVLGK